MIQVNNYSWLPVDYEVTLYLGQYVPRTGQAFTTLAEMKQNGHENKSQAFDDDDRFLSIWTEPKFGIGQRAILIKTPVGNILWDCITYLDQKTTDW